MIYIVTALHPEARPLIAHFKLKRDDRSTKIPIFSNPQMTLAVSGFGTLRSAIAASTLLTRAVLPSTCVLFNIGIAGCRDEKIPLGSAFLINKVIDHDRQKCYSPTIGYTSPLPQTTLESFNYPVHLSDRPKLVTDLVDMEAAGCFEAALTFLPTHCVHAIKIVSDHLQIFQCTHESMEQLLKKNIHAIETTLTQANQMGLKAHPTAAY